MALKPCPHCGNHISDKATKCPKCGAVLSEKDFFGSLNIQKGEATPLKSNDFDEEHEAQNKLWMTIVILLIILGLIVGCPIYFSLS